MQELRDLHRLVAKKKADEYHPAKQGITVSLLQKWLGCRYAARLYLEGWTGLGGKSSTAFGNLFHAMLQQVYEHFRIEGVPKKPELLPQRGARFAREYLLQYRKEMERVAGIEDVRALEVDLEICLLLLRPYLWRWRKDFYEREWLGLESQFDVMWKGFRLRGKRDGVYRDKKGRLRILETKTKSRLEDDWDMSRALVINLQNLFYLLATTEETGERPTGVTYNIVRRPGLRQGKKESTKEFVDRIGADITSRPSHYFHRYEIEYPKSDQLLFAASLKERLAEFQAWAEGDSGITTYRNETSCLQRWACPYLSHCSTGSLDGYVVSPIFRELEEF